MRKLALECGSPAAGKTAAHVEFTRDGRFALVSVMERAGAFEIIRKEAKPGVRIQKVCDSIKAYYKEVGLWGEQWWPGGYELGAAFPPDWVGPMSYDVERDNGAATFEEGMVLNYESDFYFPRAQGLTVFIDT